MVNTERDDTYNHGGLSVCEKCGGRRQKHTTHKGDDAVATLEVRCSKCGHSWFIPERLPVGPGSKQTAAYDWHEEGQERSASCPLTKLKQPQK